MTDTIVARDPETGMYGVAAAIHFFASGALMPHLRGDICAVATQAFVRPNWAWTPLTGWHRVKAPLTSQPIWWRAKTGGPSGKST